MNGRVVQPLFAAQIDQLSQFAFDDLAFPV